jgi:hypothetical protein
MNVNDIITESQHTCPHCGGPLVEYSGLMEKKDACYYKVKAGAKVWPSAYASGRLVQCRKKGAANYGNKSESVSEGGGAQQAAIAKRESGKYSKQDGHRLREDDTVSEGVAETVSMEDAVKVLRQYGADNFRTGSETLYFYKKGQPMSVDLIFNDDATRSVNLSQLNSATRQLKGQGVAEEWSQKYKSSINCSHPKGFSQKAHCAGKKKHNESIEMEMTCPDCGMCETHGDHSGDTLDEAYGQDALARILELGGTQLTEQLSADQQFDIIEEMVEQLAEAHGVDSDVIWEDFESVDDHELLDESAAWHRKAGKSAKGGLNRKGVASYRAEHPGSKLQMAVTTKPSKLKPGSKAAKRRKSFCARMGGVKGPMKKPNGKPTRKALALRKWNC